MDNYRDTMVRKKINKFSRSDMKTNSISYLIAMTMGIETITVGFNLVIGPLFIMESFEAQTTLIGVLFAIGAGFGALVTILLTTTECCARNTEKCLPSPVNIYVSMGGLACAVIMAAFKPFWLHVVGLLMLMAFNDLAVTYLIQLQDIIATNTEYKTIGPLGQVIRRSLSVVSAVTGPLLYGVYPKLPYLIAGGTSLLWVFLLIGAFERRKCYIRSVMTTKLKKDTLKPFCKMNYER